MACLASNSCLKVVDGFVLLLLQHAELLMLDHQAEFWEADPLDLAHKCVQLGQPDDRLDL